MVLNHNYYWQKEPELCLKEAIISLGEKEFAAGLSFVAVSRVRELTDLSFKTFNFERLQRIKDLKRVRERKEEEERLISMIAES